MNRILVAEFLLANADAAQDAAPSMLDEAAAMLHGVLEDLAALPDTDVTVLLSEDCHLFGTADCGIRFKIQRGTLQSDTLPAILRGSSEQSAFDSVLLIAPECNGVLVSLLKAVQGSAKSPPLSLNLNWRLAEIFADKRQTDAWLRQHKIPTIPTKTIDDVTIPLAIDTQHSIADSFAVLKPRDGAGADGVRIVVLGPRSFQSLPPRQSDNDRWILQPLMPGVACSIGFIGGGERGPTTMLPPARQDIQVTNGNLSYSGGQVPCDPAIASRIIPVATQLAAALGAFNGYVGVDLLVDLTDADDSNDTVCVVEINPRLCTSYVGYRALTRDNLAAWILQQHVGTPIRWKPGVVTFNVTGECQFAAAHQ